MPENPRLVWLRWVVLLLMIGALYFSSSARSTLSIVTQSVMREWGTQASQLASLFSALAVAMIPGILVALVLIYTAGVRWALAAAVLGAALAAEAGALAEGYNGMWSSRVGLGLATGGLMVIVLTGVRQFFPSGLRGIAIGLLLAIPQLTASILPVMTRTLTERLGWRLAFHGAAVIGLLVGGLWLVTVLAGRLREPETHRAFRRAELPHAALFLVGILLLAPLHSLLITWLPFILNQAYPSDGFRLVNVAFGGYSAGVSIGAIVGGIAMDLPILMSRRKYRWIAPALFAVSLIFGLAGAGAASGGAGAGVMAVALAAIGFGYQGLVAALYASLAEAIPAPVIAVPLAVGAVGQGLSGFGVSIGVGLLGTQAEMGGALPWLLSGFGLVALAGAGFAIALSLRPVEERRAETVMVTPPPLTQSQGA